MDHCEQSRINYERRKRHIELMAMHCVQYRFCNERGLWFAYERNSGWEIGPSVPPSTW